MSQKQSLSLSGENLSILYEGEKLIWSLQSTAKVLIVEHIDLQVIEIIGYLPQKVSEAPHLYLNADHLNAKVDQAIEGRSPRSNETPLDRNEIRKHLLLSHLNVTHKFADGVFELSLSSDDGKSLNELLCPAPTELKPVLNYFDPNPTKEGEIKGPNSADTAGTVSTNDISSGTENNAPSRTKSPPRSRRATTGTSTIYQPETPIETEQSVIRNFSNDDTEIDPKTGKSFSSKLWRRMRSTFFSGGGDDPTNQAMKAAVDAVNQTSPSNDAAIGGAGANGQTMNELLLKSIDEEEERAQERMREIERLKIGGSSDRGSKIPHGSSNSGRPSQTTTTTTTNSTAADAADAGTATAGTPVEDTQHASNSTSVKPRRRSLTDTLHAFGPGGASSSRKNRQQRHSMDGSNHAVDSEVTAAFTGGAAEAAQKQSNLRERRKSHSSRHAGVLGTLGLSKNNALSPDSKKVVPM